MKCCLEKLHTKMYKTDYTLLHLLSYAVSKKNIALDNNIAWESLFNISFQQGALGLVINGLQAYMTNNTTYKPFANETTADKLKRIQWLSNVVAYEKMYAKHEKAMAKLAQLYAQNNIRMMVLKGYGLSLDWPVPNHRPVGDLDIFNFGKWREADAWVAKTCGIKVDDEHEHHTIFNFNGVPIENHYDFINTKAHRDAPKIEARLKVLAEKGVKEIEVEGTKVYLPSADFNAIFLMRHMGQHFAGEHLNLRQVLDWGFFVRAHHNEVDWKTTIDFLKEIGIYIFFNQINAICVDYLGFSESCFPTIERDKDLEERILMDILHPEFAEEKPASGLIPILTFKFCRWWHNRWKHPIIYKEWLFPMFLTLLWSHLRRYKTIKD